MGRAWGDSWSADWGDSWGNDTPTPVTEEPLKGGRRLNPDDDKPTVYEELSQREIDALWPPVAVAPAHAPARVAPRRPQPVAPAPIPALDPAVYAAAFALLMEDDE